MSYVLGLDIGTTTSAAAVGDPSRTANDPGLAVMAMVGGRPLVIPSVVHMSTSGSITVGDDVPTREAADAGGFAREFKRRFGDTQPLILSGSPIAANDLVAAVARHLTGRVASERGAPPSEIIVAHPANWGEYKVSLLDDTLDGCDLPPHRLITEPMAAAIHAARYDEIAPNSIVAVYDLGGGTFDVALLRKLDGATNEAPWEPVGRPGGIERLGGVDFDTAVLHHVVSTLGIDLTAFDDDDPMAVEAMGRLRAACQVAKHTLSGDTTASIPVDLPGVAETVRLTRTEFEKLITPAVFRTLEMFDSTVASAGVEMDQIDRILLVGGSSQVPLVHQRVLSHTGRPIHPDPEPKHAVSLGAALFGLSVGAEASPAPPEEVRPDPIASGADDRGTFRASDMYRLPHISEAPLPDFLQRAAPTPPAAHPSPPPAATTPPPAAVRPSAAATRALSTPVPAASTASPTESEQIVTTAGRRRGFWLVVVAVVLIGSGIAYAGQRIRGDDGTEVGAGTGATDTTTTTSTPTTSTTAAPTTVTPLGAECSPAQRPDPSVRYRVSDVPDNEVRQTLNGRNIPSVRAVNGIESEPMTEFDEFSELDLTYEDCLVDDRGRPWWGVHFGDQVVWSSTLFIEPVP